MFKSVLETIDRLCYLPKGVEISMEGNPSSTTSLESLVQLRDLGITRYSLGIQSFQDQILKDLGRDHSATSALRSLLDAKKVWPGHVSMDLIMGHRGQTLQDWERELCFTMDIIDDHLSLYHLTIEPGTDLYKNVRAGLVSVPDHDSATDMYEAIIKITEAVGFEHYEVSNFARNKAYSQHNSGHWLGIDYLGIGPGAHGRVTDPVSGQRVRTFNIRDPSSWMTHCEETGTGLRKTIPMSIEEAKQEMVVLGMRTKSGVSYDRFKQLTQQDLLQFLDLDTVKSCIDAGLMRDSPAGLAPTERGMAVADELVVRLLP